MSVVCLAFSILFPELAAAQANGRLQIHQINVGQGDAALIISPLGETMLIDSGPASASACASPTGIITYLNGVGFTHLDYHVASHYDADHISAARIGSSLVARAHNEPGNTDAAIHGRFRLR